MNVTVNNANHQIAMGVGKNGVFKAALDGNEKVPFGQFVNDLSAKVDSDEEWGAVLRIFQLPDEIIQRSAARQAKSRIFAEKWKLANAGNFEARNDIINLFPKFGLERLLQQNMNHSNNFVTNLTSLSQRERDDLLRLEEYLFGDNRGNRI